MQTDMKFYMPRLFLTLELLGHRSSRFNLIRFSLIVQMLNLIRDQTYFITVLQEYQNYMHLVI